MAAAHRARRKRQQTKQGVATNNGRRNRIAEIRIKIEALQEELDDIAREEEDYRDNMPESLQSGERYERSEEASSALESAHDSLEEAIDSLNEIW